MGLSTGELSKIENEYIRNLQQQIYFLELEANYLYPNLRIEWCCMSVTILLFDVVWCDIGYHTMVHYGRM